MKRLFELPANDNMTVASTTLEGYVVNTNVIKKNNNNDNHHYSFIVCIADQSVVRLTKFLSKVPVCAFRTQLLESMKSGRGASITGLREVNGQYFCSAQTKLVNKDLLFRPNCVRIQLIDIVKKCSDERLCTIEAKVIFVGEETCIAFEENEFKRVQTLKKTVIVADKTGALELTLWQMHFNEVSLNNSFQIRLARVRTYNDQISLVATADTSFLRIDDIGHVIEEIDRTESLYRNDEGRIVSIDWNNDQYVCQACGSCDIATQATCLFCNVCRSRTAKQNDSVDEWLKIIIVTDNNNEYTLKISKASMMSIPPIYDQLFTNHIELVNKREKIEINSSLQVQFQYDQSTGIVQRIVPRIDTLTSSLQDKENNINDSSENDRTMDEKKSSE